MLLPPICGDGDPSASSVLSLDLGDAEDSPRRRRQQVEGYGSPKKANAREAVRPRNAEQPQEARGRSPEPLRSLRNGLSSSPRTEVKHSGSASKPPKTPRHEGGRTLSKGNSSVSASKRSSMRQGSLPPLLGSTPRGSQSPAPKHRKSSPSPMVNAVRHRGATPPTAASSSRWSSSRKRRSSGGSVSLDPEADPDLAKVLGFVALPSEVVDAFLAGLFLECSTALDGAGQPVMDGTDMRFLLSKFFGPDERDAVETGMISFRSMASTELAAHAGCLGHSLFRQVLSDIDKASPPGFVSRIISQRHFACCGDAALLARTFKALSGGPVESLSWKP
mmetsp:Transcript_1554/g.2781  ORF Transcript_1554/g.2781 Transcript_1554/m.2781 type:complete len:334 (+) Transcript_1554:38-1039(+)